jgi:hypothetical protein
LAEKLDTVLETVHSYSDCIKAVTDDSDVCWAEKWVLYEGLILYHGRAVMPREELSGPCGAICDYEVDMEAIRMVMEELGTKMNEGSKGKPTSFFVTDALLVLQALAFDPYAISYFRHDL